MTSKNFPLSRKDELVIQELKDEILIYDLKTSKAYCLNKTSAIVWQLCNGEKNVSEISKELSKKLKQTASEDLVSMAIEDFKKQNLLANSEEIQIDYNGLSRREVIRKVGMASMIALPLVASLVAPTAAQAQSPAVACGGACTCVLTTIDPFPVQLCSGTCRVGCICQISPPFNVGGGNCIVNPAGAGLLCSGTCVEDIIA